MPRRALDEDEVAALGVLHAIATERKGWMRARVRGWALGSEVNDRAVSTIATYHLQRLRDAGWVLGEAVPDPGRPRQPIVIWRITQEGENELARVEGRLAVHIASPRPDPRDAGLIYTSRDAWACLTVLQSRPGPVSWAALVDEVHRRFRTWVYMDDAKMLFTRGLAERSEQGSGRQKIVWLHPTPIGREVRLVDGRTNQDIVQLRIPQHARAGTLSGAHRGPDNGA